MSDAHPNFAASTVATAPSPATSGTSLVVASGEGARFGSVFPFNAVIAPAGSDPTSATGEIVRVTNRSTDTLTIARTQESTSARTVVVGDRIYVAPTGKTMTDADIAIPNYKSWAQDYNITSTATAPLQDIDSTNLAVTTDPVPGTALVVWLTAIAGAPTTSALFWGLKESTSNVGDGPKYVAYYNSTTILVRVTVPIIVTGLTPGSVHTYKWAAYVASGTGKTNGATGAGASGAMTMFVQMLP